MSATTTQILDGEEPQPLVKKTFSAEESHTLHEMRWSSGVLTLNFRDHRNGGAAGKCEYDYPDPHGEHVKAILGAARPGTEARSRIKSGSLTHSAIRDISKPAGAAKMMSAGLSIVPSSPVPPPKADQEQQLQRTVLSVTQQADRLTIQDQMDYDAAVGLAQVVKDLRAKAEEHHRPLISSAYQTHKLALEALKKIDDPLAGAERVIKGKIITWTNEQERIRAEAERIAREAAERQAAEALEAQVEELEAFGASAVEVQAVIEQAKHEPVAAPIIAPTFQSSSSASLRKALKPEVSDFAALVKHIAANPQLLNLLSINQPALNAMVKAQGAGLRLPGVKVVEVSSLALYR